MIEGVASATPSLFCSKYFYEFSVERELLHDAIKNFLLKRSINSKQYYPLYTGG